jgi:hypothetical protein
MKSLIPAIAVSGLVSVASMAQSGTLPKAARAGIDAGNQAWIDGVKTGNIPLISATYAEDAVDCGPTGECTKGRLLIEQHMTTELASRGRARSASVKSSGASQNGNFVTGRTIAERTWLRNISLCGNYKRTVVGRSSAIW